MKNIKNCIGKEYGIYKIIGISEKKSKSGHTLCDVQCKECGQIVQRDYYNITNENRIVKKCRHNNKKYEFVQQYCMECNKPIELNGNSLSEYYKRKFCSISCHVSYNNKNRKKKYTKQCVVCGKWIPERNQYCSGKCLQIHKYNKYIEEWKSGNNSGRIGQNWIDVSSYIRKYLFEKYDYKCAKCGWSETNKYTNTIPLEIEHIDGNALNNSEENLLLLCPNCHSLTKTYRGANKGNGKRDIKWLARCGSTNKE